MFESEIMEGGKKEHIHANFTFIFNGEVPATQVALNLYAILGDNAKQENDFAASKMMTLTSSLRLLNFYEDLWIS